LKIVDILWSAWNFLMQTHFEFVNLSKVGHFLSQRWSFHAMLMVSLGWLFYGYCHWSII